LGDTCDKYVFFIIIQGKEKNNNNTYPHPSYFVTCYTLIKGQAMSYNDDDSIEQRHLFKIEEKSRQILRKFNKRYIHQDIIKNKS
jgi:hypothetical protein